MTAFGVARPFKPVRCARCNKLVLDHFNGAEMVSKCSRCGVVLVITGERKVNALYPALVSA